MNLLNGLESMGHYCYFALLVLPALLSAVRKPVELFNQLYNVLIGALPLGLVTGIALGIVVWIHISSAIESSTPLSRDQVIAKVPEYLAMAIVVEFAPLGAGMIVAGRTGASLGAELGSMRLTEQLDALEVMGQSPIDKLVGPRVLACMAALPILTIFIAYISIASSFLAQYPTEGMSWSLYMEYAFQSLTLQRMLPATLKTIVFGFVIGVTGCYCGMEATGGTEGVGNAATQGVVVSIFMVMITNVILVQLIELFC